MTILPDLSDLVIEHVSVTNDVTITIRAASPAASCPCCGMISKRVHSHYLRTLRDLPASGRPVPLMVQVRRFFCQESTCVRKIKASRFPSLTLPRVKFPLRLPAVQVADRWHVVKNLGESLSTLLARCRAESRRATCAETIPEEEQREQAEEPHPYRSRKEEQARLARRAERQARYAQVLFLRQRGGSE